MTKKELFRPDPAGINPIGANANAEIRQVIKKSGLKQWQVAQSLGIREDTFSRMLRLELSADMKQKILDTLVTLKHAQEETQYRAYVEERDQSAYVEIIDRTRKGKMNK